MKITQIRETESAEAISVLNLESFVEKIKVEIKARPVSGFREALHYVLPGESCHLSGKLPKIIPAVAFGRVNGVKRMKAYNGIVELSVGPLAGKAEIEIVKKKAAELPQINLLLWDRAERPSRYGLILPDRMGHYHKHKRRQKYFMPMRTGWR